jgi:MFS family permease
MAFSGYLHLIASHRHVLAFGFSMTFASSVGQTFFIGIFGPSVRTEFGFDHTAWGGLYMIGTLLSAALLPWTGQRIDRVPLERYSLMVAAALVVAAGFMAAVPSVALLVLAIFLLRQAGQGLASHTGTTAMARHFRGDRGKAIALASMGYAVGEATLPFLAVVAIAAIGWRATYGATAGLVAFVLPALLIWLLRRREPPQKSPQSGAHGLGWPATAAPRARSRIEVLVHRSFYLLLPAVLAPSCIVTALFFHHLELAAMKGWSATWITGSYWVYALGSVATSLLAGPIIDKITAARVMPVLLLPLIAGLSIVAAFDSSLWAWPYLLLIGVTSGLTYTVVTAFWAEVYGLDHLGAIRSMVIALSVFASALGPVIMGAMMDGGLMIEAICGWFALYGLGASGFLLLSLKGYRAEGLAGQS